MRALFFRFVLLCAGELALATLCAAQSAPPVPTCDAIAKFVNAKGATAFSRDRATALGPNAWSARTQIAQGACSLGELKNFYWLGCTFNQGASASDLTSYNQTMIGAVQTCLNGLKSRNDWRERAGPVPGVNGQTLTQTRWIWTTLRNQEEREIQVNIAAGGTFPSSNQLVIQWRAINLISSE